MATPEGKVTNEIKKFLEDLKRKGAPIFFFKVAGSARQRRGLPDWHVTFMGRSFWFEVKRPGWKPPELETLQGRTIKRIRNAGGLANYVTSVEDVAEVLKSIDTTAL